MTDTAPIDSFTGKYRFLSNFWTGNPILFAGVYWPTAEHLFQAAKTVDPVQKRFILTASTPSQAKRRGKMITLRPNWDEVRVPTMWQVLTTKFANSEELTIKLLSTGDRELIEGNTWGDTFWGQCPLGTGENVLGKLLMSLRTELRNATN